MADNQAITAQPIPEQVIYSGDEVYMDLGQYFECAEDDVLKFSIERFPMGLEVDERTGIVIGKAPDIAMNVPFLVGVTAHSHNTGKKQTVDFPLTILAAELSAEASPESTAEHPVTGTQELQAKEQPKPAAGMYNEAMSEKQYFDDARRWELIRWIQFIINEHYACVYLYNGESVPDRFGALQSQRTATCGFEIYNYENYLVIGMGNKAFEEYGNRGRLLRAVEEALRKDLPNRGWNSIGITGSDMETVGKAWVVARLLGLPVSKYAPSEEARFNYDLLSKFRKPGDGTGLFPTPAA